MGTWNLQPGTLHPQVVRALRARSFGVTDEGTTKRTKGTKRFYSKMDLEPGTLDVELFSPNLQLGIHQIVVVRKGLLAILPAT